MPSFEKIFQFLAHQSKLTSLHGFKYVFWIRKSYAVRFWIFAIMFSFAVCCFYVVLTAHSHIITRPVVTAIEFSNLETLSFPNVLLCPQMLSHDTFQKTMFQHLKTDNTVIWELFMILTHAALNPLYSDFRFELKNNLTSAFDKYSVLDDKWKSMVGQRDVAEEIMKSMGTFLSNIISFCKYIKPTLSLD